MPYQHELTWIAQTRRWRKRYLGKTYFLKSPSQGKKDRAGYLAALREWERLKAFLDGLGPNPYTETGAIIPESQVLQSAPVYIPPMATPTVSTNGATVAKRARPEAPQAGESSNHPKWMLGTGFGPMLHPEQVATNGNGSPYHGETRIRVLADFWLDHRHKQAQRGELSLKQWSEDKAKLQVFRDFLLANYPTVAHLNQLHPAILNHYRDHQWEFTDPGSKHGISKATLKKRLDTVAKWLHWLVDQNILDELPKDLRTYGRVKLDKPKPIFWTPEEIKLLAKHATERTRLYVMLGLNLGYTQRDIATLTPDMVDWDTGIVTRDRKKTGIASKAKLWRSTMDLLLKHHNPNPGPVLVDQKGSPLYAEQVNGKGNLITLDSIRLAFDRVKNSKRVGLKGDPRSFKHLRKSAANEIERTRPDLTGLFLAHSEGGVKRHYVSQHFDELFTETDKLAKLFGF
ncbi:MAG: hypothetical protein WDZ51_03430 [Pirellulaceae bacterium]